MTPKVKMALSGIILDYQSKQYSILSKIERFIIHHFFPRKCWACNCGSCQLAEDGRKYWYCPHLKNNICTICCIYDSLGETWKECYFCSHDQDRDRCWDTADLNKLWEPKDADSFYK